MIENKSSIKYIGFFCDGKKKISSSNNSHNVIEKEIELDDVLLFNLSSKHQF